MDECVVVDAFKELNGFGWGNVVLMFLLFLILFVAFLQSIHFICDYFGIETKQSLEQKNRDEEIKRLKEEITKLQESSQKFSSDRVHDREQSFEIQRNLLDNFAQFSTTLTEIKQDLLEEKIERKRWNVLNFADELRHNNGEADAERFNNVFKDYDDYERLIEEIGQHNGYVEESIKFIRSQYQRMLNNN
ncbi:MAG: hypothetical protein ACI32P_00610 [Catenibacterium mitsuokai]